MEHKEGRRMTFDRPKGEFAVSNISHLGVSARCCYNEVEFEVRDDRGTMYLYFFGKPRADEDRYMDNSIEVMMTKEQMLDLSDYIRRKAQEADL